MLIRLGKTGPHRIRDFHAIRCFLLHALQNRDALAFRHRRSIIAEHTVTVCRMVADHCYFFIFLCKRKHRLFIFQKHSRLPRQCKRYLRDAGFFRGKHVFFHIRMLEQTFFKFQFQNAEHRLIDLALLQKFLINRLTETAKGFIPQAHINTGLSCRNGCMQRIPLCVFQEIDSQSVCHHNAVKAHLTAQYIAKQPCISVAVHAVDLVIRRHDSFHTGFAARFCRRKMDFTQLTLPDSRRTRIHTSGRLALGAEMFCHAADAGRLHAGHGCFCHCGCKAWVLRVALFTSSPSRITRHIKCRHQRQLHMTAL